MPDRWDDIRRIIDFLGRLGVTRITLLVVPGQPWRTEQLDGLRQYAREGLLLAGHGWSHEIGRWGGLYHRLHGAFLSRRVAEHLALSADEITDLVSRCHAWFAQRELPVPDLYVPPAWAIGRVTRDTLAGLPFRYYEQLNGILDKVSGRFFLLPLLGYQADRRWRVAALSISNALNSLYAAARTRPIRIAIHPGDLELPLRRHLEHTLRGSRKFIDHHDL
jgi:hypothetical protein